MVDTEPLARAAWEQVVAPFGLATTDGLYGRMLGRRTHESAQLVLDALPLPLARDELVARKTAVFLESLRDGVPVMPGLWPLLDTIDARGLPWGVATSTPRAVAEIILAKLGVVGRYRALAAGDEVAHGKPAPDIFLLAAQRLGVPAAGCLVLEDSEPGAQAARAAGMIPILVPDLKPPSAEGAALAYRVLPSLHDVKELLQTQLVLYGLDEQAVGSEIAT